MDIAKINLYQLYLTRELTVYIHCNKTVIFGSSFAHFIGV